MMHPSVIAWRIEALWMLPNIPYEVRRCIIDDELQTYSREKREMCRLFLVYEERRILKRLSNIVRHVCPKCKGIDMNMYRRRNLLFRLKRARLLKTLVNDSLELDAQMIRLAS